MPSIRPGTGAQGQEAKGLANPSESWLVGGAVEEAPPQPPLEDEQETSAAPASPGEPSLLPARGALPTVSTSRLFVRAGV